MANVKNMNQQPTDENGKRHGEWFIYYSNGELCSRGNCIHGVDHGLIEGFTVNGNLQYRGYINMGRQTGFWYHFSNPEIYYLCLI